MSDLSNELLSQFAKTVKGDKKESTESTVKGVVVEYEGRKYVRVDGSDLLTPVTSTVAIEPNDRVNVLIKDHTATVTGNLSSPSASQGSVDNLGAKVDEFDVILADKVSTEDLEAINATIGNLKAETGKFEELSSVYAKIEKLEADYANLEHMSAKDAEILNAEIDNLKAEIADVGVLTAEEIDAINGEFDNLKAYNADFTYVSADRLSAMRAEIKELDVKKLDAESADIKYANIDFTNISEATISKLFTEYGVIKELVISEGTVVKELVGVTIKGDLIEAGTLKADKLVVLGSDGIYYKLNVDALGETTVSGMTQEEQEALQNGLHGTAIVAKSITAEKIRVDDLVAFGATIGGFNITTNALYSGVKSSVDNTTRGIYLDKNGQVVFGDASNFIKYYKDANDVWRLEIQAATIRIGSSNKTVEEEIEEIKDNVTCNLKIESSRGTVFKNNNISTVLSVVIFRGGERITDINALRSAMGSSAYLQWKWQREDDETFGVISSSDSHLSNDGFSYSISADEVDSKVTFLCELIV